MKLIYKGKFNGDLQTLPHGEHIPGAVKIKECDDPKKLGLLANAVALVVMLGLLALYFWRAGGVVLSLHGCVAPMLVLLPHELLHALCFRGEVYLYTNLAQGMLFVTGPETMSRGRFVFLSLLPNIVFGFLPYAAAMVWPQVAFLGVFGAITISMGAGDYYNVYNALTQIPRGGRTYLYGFGSYWYMPQRQAYRDN